MNDSFINESLIIELKQIKSKDFDLIRLIQLCKEINDNYRNENYFSVGMLGRTILHHIPPIFDCKNFDEVVNNYAKRSFKRSMQHLRNTVDIADTMLHQQIIKVDSLPTPQQVNFIQSMDVLIQEIIKILKSKI